MGKLDGENLVYTPAAGYSGIDTLSYQVSDSDGFGSEATITFNVLSKTAGVQSDNQIGNVKPSGDGSMIVTFAGIPGLKYQVQASDNISGPWMSIGDPVEAGADGLFNYKDVDAKIHPNSRYYRTVKPANP